MSVNTMSNFPNGFANGISVRGMPLLSSYPGKVFWVDSGAPGGKGTFERPMATIDAAVALCTANNGDIIVVKPGHVETVSAAAGLAQGQRFAAPRIDGHGPSPDSLARLACTRRSTAANARTSTKSRVIRNP